MEIIKKIYSESFENISSGKKKFELRLADEKYNIGDILVLKEIDSDYKIKKSEEKLLGDATLNSIKISYKETEIESNKYANSIITAIINYVLNT